MKRGAWTTVAAPGSAGARTGREPREAPNGHDGRHLRGRIARTARTLATSATSNIAAPMTMVPRPPVQNSAPAIPTTRISSTTTTTARRTATNLPTCGACHRPRRWSAHCLLGSSPGRPAEHREPASPVARRQDDALHGAVDQEPEQRETRQEHHAPAARFAARPGTEREADGTREASTTAILTQPCYRRSPRAHHPNG